MIHSAAGKCANLIFDEESAFGINLYEMLQEHRAMCALTSNKKDLFPAPNHRASEKSRFLKSTAIGKNSLSRHWEEIVTATNARSVGPHDKPVLHSLRKTLINYLMRARFTLNQIVLRTGHKSVESITPYANIQGEAGMRLQQ